MSLAMMIREKLILIFTLKNILNLISVIILFLIFLISLFDASYGGDSWMYHIPFAARIWGIISPEQYTFEYGSENRFLGFPLLAHFLQGFFWFIFQKPEATNLVCFFSLLLLIFFLTKVLKIPCYLATLSLLAIPMVHMHAASSHIDLPGNVSLSILILTIYLVYINKIELNAQTLSIIILSAAAAANIKYPLIPVVFLILCFLLVKLFWQYWQSRKTGKLNFKSLSRLIIISSLASLLIFATPVKNILVHGNPFYPVKVEIAGIVLNHTESVSNFTNENLLKFPPSIRWVRSVLEINAFDDRRPWKWTLGMDYIPLEDERFGVGGFLGGYVILNVLLFSYLCWQNWYRDTKFAVALMIILSLFTSVLPQSYELRYYMYWMIVFVSLNSYLLCSFQKKVSQNLRLNKFVNPVNFALIATGFMFVFMHQTYYYYTFHEFRSYSKLIKREDIIQPKIFQQIQEDDQVCIVGKTPNTFLYNSYFHSPARYSVKAEFNISDEFVQEKCGDRKILK